MGPKVPKSKKGKDRRRPREIVKEENWWVSWYAKLTFTLSGPGHGLDLSKGWLIITFSLEDLLNAFDVRGDNNIKLFISHSKIAFR
jgi:hypothetical protein